VGVASGAQVSIAPWRSGTVRNGALLLFPWVEVSG
jgi:hypothetical protein